MDTPKRLLTGLVALALSVLVPPSASGQSNGYGVVEWGARTFDIRGFNKPFVQIAAGMWHTAALKTDGTVVAWGDNLYGQSEVPVAWQSYRDRRWIWTHSCG